MENAKKIWEELKLLELTPRVPWHGYELGYWPDSWNQAAQRAAGEYLKTGEDYLTHRTPNSPTSRPAWSSHRRGASEQAAAGHRGQRLQRPPAGLGRPRDAARQPRRRDPPGSVRGAEKTIKAEMGLTHDSFEALADATILPPVPAFYHQPKSIDDLLAQTAGKILDQFAISHNPFSRWDGTTPALHDDQTAVHARHPAARRGHRPAGQPAS